MEWYLMVWRKYADFEGRSRRKEYWTFTLINLVILCSLELLGLALFTATRTSVLGALIFGVAFIYSLALLVPSLACGARRLHDIGMSGWLQLIGFVPALGGIVLIVLLALDSNPGPNQYGPNPKLVPPLTMNS